MERDEEKKNDRTEGFRKTIYYCNKIAIGCISEQAVSVHESQANCRNSLKKACPGPQYGAGHAGAGPC